MSEVDAPVPSVLPDRFDEEVRPGEQQHRQKEGCIPLDQQARKYQVGCGCEWQADHNERPYRWGLAVHAVGVSRSVVVGVG